MADDPQLYQIVYDDRTLDTRDPDLDMLDNLDNLRPDWSEYWPIRRFLLNTEILDTTYYGFFSPKFLQKASILAKSVKSLLKERTEDVVLFSPFLDQSALFLNQVEQGGISHPGFLQLFAALHPVFHAVLCEGDGLAGERLRFLDVSTPDVTGIHFVDRVEVVRIQFEGGMQVSQAEIFVS